MRVNKPGRPKSGRQKLAQIQVQTTTKNQLKKLKPSNQTWDSFLTQMIILLTTPKG